MAGGWLRDVDCGHGFWTRTERSSTVRDCQEASLFVCHDEPADARIQTDAVLMRHWRAAALGRLGIA
jgi:hypothetical protein